MPASKQSYYKCLFHMTELAAKGVSFSSNASHAYFAALFKKGGPVDKGLAAKAYKAMALKDGDGLLQALADYKCGIPLYALSDRPTK